jgi:hypothetical protein
MRRSMAGGRYAVDGRLLVCFSHRLLTLFV